MHLTDVAIRFANIAGTVLKMVGVAGHKGKLGTRFGSLGGTCSHRLHMLGYILIIPPFATAANGFISSNKPDAEQLAAIHNIQHFFYGNKFHGANIAP